jgi:hypothetical protein
MDMLQIRSDTGESTTIGHDEYQTIQDQQIQMAFSALLAED